MKNPQLRIHDSASETEAERFINSLIDIIETIPNVEKIIKKILRSKNIEQEQNELLQDFELEMQHVIYHIHDSIFLRGIYDHVAESHVGPK